MRVSELKVMLSKLPDEYSVLMDVKIGTGYSLVMPVQHQVREHYVILRNYVVESYAQTITCEGQEYEQVQRTFGRGKE